MQTIYIITGLSKISLAS